VTCGAYGENINAYKICLNTLTVRKYLEMFKLIQKDKIKTVLREIGCRDVNWIQLPQYRTQWRAFLMMVMNILVLQHPKISVKFNRPNY
jgi:hypothetical protein